MRMRRFIVGDMVAGTLLLIAALPAAAASITYTPTTISYGVPSVTKVTGLTPNASYGIQIYNPSGVPLIPGGYPLVADATGSFSTADLTPDQTDVPGTYLFEVNNAGRQSRRPHDADACRDQCFLRAAPPEHLNAADLSRLSSSCQIR